MPGNEPLLLDENRFFDPDPSIRRVARTLYESVKDLPIISPHGHVDPKRFAENEPFPDPTELIFIPDHYIFRMLHSQGIAMESLGIPTIDGSWTETDHRKIWQIFGDHFHLFAGTPTGIWLKHELVEVFGIDEKLNSDTAQRIYDRIEEKLKLPEFLPRAMYTRFNIEVLTTTDKATDTLEHHRALRDSDWKGTVIPCFRPDAAVGIMSETWMAQLALLGEAAGMEIGSYRTYIEALENRRRLFISMGATSTDHAVLIPYTHRLSDNEAERIFQKALQKKSTMEDAMAFTAHMLMEFARMSVEDGLVMQIHPGSLHDHDESVYRRFGTDKGCDIPVQTEYTYNLMELLQVFGSDPRFTVIVFTLDESTYSRELAPLAGHYPAMKLGPPWWFHDSIEGMTRFRQRVIETAGVYNTVGFNDDTRAFPSIPARHDLARRIDANFLAGLVTRHIIDVSEAGNLIHALAYDLAKKAYKLA